MEVSIIYRKMYRVHGVWFINLLVDGKQFRKSTGKIDHDDAKIVEARYIRHIKNKTGKQSRLYIDSGSKKADDPSADWSSEIESCATNSRSWLRRLYQRSKDRSAKKGIEFTLTLDDFIKMSERSKGLCELTGSQFGWDKPNSCRFSPFAPSIDRINPKKGYTSENTRLICYGVNVAMSDWGLEVARSLLLKTE